MVHFEEKIQSLALFLCFCLFFPLFCGQKPGNLWEAFLSYISISVCLSGWDDIILAPSVRYEDWACTFYRSFLLLECKRVRIGDRLGLYFLLIDLLEEGTRVEEHTTWVFAWYCTVLHPTILLYVFLPWKNSSNWWRVRKIKRVLSGKGFNGTKRDHWYRLCKDKPHHYWRRNERREAQPLNHDNYSIEKVLRGLSSDNGSILLNIP